MPNKKADDALVKDLKEELETSSESGDKQAEDSGEASVLTKVKVGEDEIESDELAKLVAKGKKALEIEKEQNIDISELYPDYTRKSQLLKDPEKLKEHLSSQLGVALEQQSQSKSNDGVEIPDEVKTEIAKARKLGFLTKEDVDTIVEQAVQKATARSVAEVELKTRLSELKDKYDGSENAPIPVKFNENEVIEYILNNFKGANKVPDPEDVFKLIHLQDFQKNAGATKKVVQTPPVTEKAGSTGARVPKGREVPKFSDEDAMKKYIEEEFLQEQTEV